MTQEKQRMLDFDATSEAADVAPDTSLQFRLPAVYTNARSDGNLMPDAIEYTTVVKAARYQRELNESAGYFRAASVTGLAWLVYGSLTPSRVFKIRLVLDAEGIHYTSRARKNASKSTTQLVSDTELARLKAAVLELAGKLKATKTAPKSTPENPGDVSADMLDPALVAQDCGLVRLTLGEFPDSATFVSPLNIAAISLAGGPATGKPVHIRLVDTDHSFSVLETLSQVLYLVKLARGGDKRA